jgi:hypothetical protein
MNVLGREGMGIDGYDTQGSGWIASAAAIAGDPVTGRDVAHDWARSH